MKEKKTSSYDDNNTTQKVCKAKGKKKRPSPNGAFD